MLFRWDENKNQLIFEKRWLRFEMINENNIFIDELAQNQEKYPWQRYLICEINDYPVYVAYEKRNDENWEYYHLITMMYARKYKDALTKAKNI